PAARVEQRAAGIPRIDRGIGLDHVLERAFPLLVRHARSRAETIPVVSDQSRPNGLPMANTFCPTLRSALAPIGSGGGRRWATVMRSTARSCTGLAPTSVAS